MKKRIVVLGIVVGCWLVGMSARASSMTELGRWRPLVETHHIAANGTWLYMGSGRTLYVVDASDPATIRVAATLDLTPWSDWVDVIHDLAYWNNHVFAFSDHGKLMAIHVGNPNAPRIVSNVAYSTSPHWSGRSLRIHNGRAYICLWLPSAGNYDVTIIDVSNPSNQRRRGGIGLQNSPNIALPIGQRLYVGMLDGRGLQVYDLANPNWPQLLGASTFGLHPSPTVHDITAVGPYIVLATSSGLLSVDAVNPLNMQLKDRIAAQTFPPSTPFRGDVWRVVKVSDRECVVVYDDGVAKVRIHDDGSLAVVEHVSVQANRAVYTAGRLYTASSWANMPPLVVFDQPPPPFFMSPSGTLDSNNRRPVFEWSDTFGATWYQVWIQRNGRTYADHWVPGSTTWIPSWDFQHGTYEWWVRGWGPVIEHGAWSRSASFSIPQRIPGVIPRIGPQGAQGSHDLTYRWNKDAYATWYRLWVGHQGRTWHDQWYEGSGEGILEVPLTGHPGGSFEWWLHPWGPDGFGPWSGPTTFTTPSQAPGIPLLTAPEGVQAHNRPLFAWELAHQTDWYRIVVRQGAQTLLDTWTQETELLAPSILPQGALTWWVGAWNAVTRQTVWSNALHFQTPSALPAAPVLAAPLGGGTTATPEYQWEAQNADWYRVYVQRSGGGVVLDRWTQQQSLPSPGALAPGAYTWWVAGWNAVTGRTAWSEQGDFTVE